MSNSGQYSTFKEFYPFYLSEHANPTNRFLHVLGTTIALSLILLAVFTSKFWLIGIAIIQGYAWAWCGHFLIEKNRPATFTYPLYSFMGDWLMWFEVITFQRGLRDKL